MRPLDTSYTQPWTCNPRFAIASCTVGIRFAELTCSRILSLAILQRCTLIPRDGPCERVYPRENRVLGHVQPSHPEYDEANYQSVPISYFPMQQYSLHNHNVLHQSYCFGCTANDDVIHTKHFH